uniref:High mobility group B1, putative n=1 Tax=Riptortus pedestris TaxID=329032 RepID=R4WDW2_RIPPE|nr:high mobility group B1, putative [Riptortus pedestris]
MQKVQTKSQKPRGKVSAYAFFVQTCREEHKKKHPDENVIFTEFSKKCSERWRTMSEKERKRFHELADQDKKRYETEMETYIPSENEKGRRGKKRKQIKDPKAPKRPLTAFFLFISDERSNVKQANPEFTVGEISKELGRRWAAADSSIKSKYEEKADKDKARYEKEMAEYKKRGKFSSLTAAPTKEEDNEDDEEEEDNNLE